MMARTRTTVLFLIVASLALILWDLRASDTTLRTAAQDVMTPLQRTATAVFSPVGAWARQVQEFDDPVVRTRSAAEIALVAPEGWTGATGRVVAADISGTRATVTVDVGEADGLTRGNAVLAPGGLVGQVTRVSADAATVLLVTDPQSTIGARVLPSEEMGVATGAGMGNPLELAILNPAADVAAGQQVVTLGSADNAGIPADLPLGVIAAMNPAPASGRSAQVRPVTSMTSLDTVLVLTGPR